MCIKVLLHRGLMTHRLRSFYLALSLRQPVLLKERFWKAWYLLQSQQKIVTACKIWHKFRICTCVTTSTASFSGVSCFTFKKCFIVRVQRQKNVHHDTGSWRMMNVLDDSCKRETQELSADTVAAAFTVTDNTHCNTLSHTHKLISTGYVVQNVPSFICTSFACLWRRWVTFNSGRHVTTVTYTDSLSEQFSKITIKLSAGIFMQSE